jgi:3-deoxy-D-manno-octulosonic acid (KDO) 8-phosphate synthase
VSHHDDVPTISGDRHEELAPHRMRSIIGVNGIARDGVLTCECGWTHKYERIVAALRAHHDHAQSHHPAVH